MKTLLLSPQESLADFSYLPNLPSLTMEPLDLTRPDRHCLVFSQAGQADQVSARCSLWWTRTPAYPDHRVGLVGHYAAADDESAAWLLNEASEALRAQGCTLAIGPLNGNTWQSYRFVTAPGDEPSFFLEPDNPDVWPCQFVQNDFRPLAHYVSMLNPDLSRPNPRFEAIGRRAEKAGIRLRPFVLDPIEEVSSRIYKLALASFSQNFLYTPISYADFKQLYQPAWALIGTAIANFSLLAEYESDLIGFLFALPDFCQAQRGETIDTLIIKTVAVHPGYRRHGLANWMAHRAERLAYQQGYKRAIHALIYEQNVSLKISRRHQTRKMRGYTLFAKAL